MPDHLVFVRHGESEGNVVQQADKKGDSSLYTDKFRKIPGRKWPLTELGVEQAQSAGKWIRTNISETFDRYYVSPFLRTRQTAAHLGLPDAQWFINRRVRERDWGEIQTTPRSEYKDISASNEKIRNMDFLYWRPPAGESLADVQIRVRMLFDTLHRECDEKKVIVVSHGEFIDACRAELEYMNDDHWDEVSKDANYKLFNAHVMHYSRIDPSTGERLNRLRWFQSVCPWVDDRDESWHEIIRKKYSNEDLLS